MASYYNATSGPLSFNLRDGSSAVIAPKKWAEIPAGQDSSASMVRLLRQGFLIRKDVAGEAVVDLPSSKPLNPPAAKPVAAKPAQAAAKAPVAEAPKAKVEPVKAEPAKAESKEPAKVSAPASVPTASVSGKDVASAGTSTPSKDK